MWHLWHNQYNGTLETISYFIKSWTYQRKICLKNLLLINIHSLKSALRILHSIHVSYFGHSPDQNTPKWELVWRYRTHYRMRQNKDRTKSGPRIHRKTQTTGDTRWRQSSCRKNTLKICTFWNTTNAHAPEVSVRDIGTVLLHNHWLKQPAFLPVHWCQRQCVQLST